MSADLTAAELFRRCTTRTRYDYGLEIRCKLGLWSCWSCDESAVESEARHYWAQYHRDGEYDKLLATRPASTQEERG